MSAEYSVEMSSSEKWVSWWNRARARRTRPTRPSARAPRCRRRGRSRPGRVLARFPFGEIETKPGYDQCSERFTKEMDVVAVSSDGGRLDLPVLVVDPVRLVRAARAALNRLPIRIRRVRNTRRDVLDAVPLDRGPLANVPGCRSGGRWSARGGCRPARARMSAIANSGLGPA